MERKHLKIGQFKSYPSSPGNWNPAWNSQPHDEEQLLTVSAEDCSGRGHTMNDEIVLMTGNDDA